MFTLGFAREVHTGVHTRAIFEVSKIRLLADAISAPTTLQRSHEAIFSHHIVYLSFVSVSGV
jgi:hypothetical protein